MKRMISQKDYKMAERFVIGINRQIRRLMEEGHTAEAMRLADDAAYSYYRYKAIMIEYNSPEQKLLRILGEFTN